MSAGVTGGVAGGTIGFYVGAASEKRATEEKKRIEEEEKKKKEEFENKKKTEEERIRVEEENKKKLELKEELRKKFLEKYKTPFTKEQLEELKKKISFEPYNYYSCCTYNIVYIDGKKYIYKLYKASRAVNARRLKKIFQKLKVENYFEVPNKYVFEMSHKNESETIVLSEYVDYISFKAAKKKGSITKEHFLKLKEFVLASKFGDYVTFFDNSGWNEKTERLVFIDTEGKSFVNPLPSDYKKKSYLLKAFLCRLRENEILVENENNDKDIIQDIETDIKNAEEEEKTSDSFINYNGIYDKAYDSETDHYIYE